MIGRYAEQKLMELSKVFPIVAVTGPRQSGKTTLVKFCFAGYKYCNLENLDIREEIRLDPSKNYFTHFRLIMSKTLNLRKNSGTF
jgi:predicted AAA+ superfamily ATPase